MTIQQQIYDMYQQSKVNTENGSVAEQAFVALYEINIKAIKEKADLTAKLDAALKNAANLSHQIQFLETRVAISEGSYSKEISAVVH